MGDIGDYWRDHKEYVQRKKYGSAPKEVEFQCSCGKKYYGFGDGPKIKAHMKAKGDGHALVKGEFYDDIVFSVPF
jgi:hypothetical protein